MRSFPIIIHLSAGLVCKGGNLRQTYETCKPLISWLPCFVSKLTVCETSSRPDGPSTTHLDFKARGASRIPRPHSECCRDTTKCESRSYSFVSVLGRSKTLAFQNCVTLCYVLPSGFYRQKLALRMADEPFPMVLRLGDVPLPIISIIRNGQ